MGDVMSILILVALVPLVTWVSVQRSRRIADDVERLMHDILEVGRGDTSKPGDPRVYAKVDDRLCSCLVSHFEGLNAAGKSLRVVAENACPMSDEAIVTAVNAMQKAEGKNSIPQPIVKLVLDGLLAGGLLVLRKGHYQASMEGKLLNELILPIRVRD